MLQRFYINKDEHYSYRHKVFGLPLLAKISPTFKNVLQFTVMFDFSCKYDNKSMGIDGEDINKLYGLQYALTDHQGSVRVGWRYNIDTNKIELFAYVHENGKIRVDRIGSTTTGVINTFTITMHDTYAHVLFTNNKGEKIVSVMVLQRKPWKLRFRLWPYFGGTKSAPHKMYMIINEK